MARKLFGTVVTLLLLGGCNSTENVLKVEGGEQSPGTAQAVPAPGINPATATASQSGTVRMRFAPIIGAPVDKVTPMSRRLNARAQAAKVDIVASNDPGATHVLKGYFSVLGEGSVTTVIYVFDVLDTAGNRLHRIQGQEMATGSNTADPWSSVPASLMETIADKTMTEFQAWRTKTAA